MAVDEDIEQWQQAVRRVCALVEEAGDEDRARHVPATPGWTVRDLLSHMVGLGADVLAGDEPNDHHESWTRAQVEARAGRSVEELVEEWRALVAPLSALMAEQGTRPLGDVVIHEQDLRGALARPGARDTAGLRAVRASMAGRFERAAADLPPLLVVGTEDGVDDGAEVWRLETGRAVDGGADQVLIEAPAFDVFRALTSRRTPDQLRGWTRHGDCGPHLAAFAGLGPLPTEPLPE